MKPDTHVSTTMKIVNMMIIAMVAAGAVIFAVANQASSGREVTTTLFLAFLGAIITVQIIPCIVLMGSILKGIINLVRKQASPEGADHDK